MVLWSVVVFLVSACHTSLLVWDNAATLSIDLDVLNKALFLTYEFESPVRAVRFSHRPERARRPGWSVLDPEIDLNGHVVSRTDSRPFERVSITVGIEEDSTDQAESAVRAIGEAGLVIFNANLWLEGITVTDITANIARGQVVVHEGFVSDVGAEKVVLERVEPLHVYFGDRTALTYVGDSMFVASADPENRLLTAIRNSLEPATQWIDAFFESSSRSRPIVFVIFSEDDDMAHGWFSGVATSGGEIFLSFRGDSGMWQGNEHEGSAQRGLFHELVHHGHFVWLGFQGMPAAPQLWQAEGLAGYLDITYAHSAGGHAGEQTFLSEMEHLASECLNMLEEGNFGIARASAQAGTTIYDECGVLAYWLIDGQPRTANRADRLRTVFAQMKEMPGTFNVGKLRRTMVTDGGNEAWEPLQMLIQGPRGRQWQRRDQLLGRAGIGAAGRSDVPSAKPVISNQRD